MKIAVISASFVPSNTANSIQMLKSTQALLELGHEVVLFVPGIKTVDFSTIQSLYGLRKQIDIRWIKENLALKRYDFALKAIKAARETKPDMVYTWVLQAGVLALQYHLPTILELHDRVTGKFGPWLLKRFIKEDVSRRILTNTQALRQVIISKFKIENSKNDIITSPNGVDLEQFIDLPSPEEARKNLALRGGFTAGYTGHFYKGRGISLLFDLAKALSEINFLWVGGREQDVDLWKNRVSDTGIENIHIAGFVENAVLPQYQAACEVLMMPYGTTIEGSGGGDNSEIASPMKMFEYMASGRAIISSDLPVIKEVLNKDMAIFCPPDSLSHWKQAVLDLRVDSEKRSALGTVASDAVREYTWKKRAERALDGFV